MYLYRLACQTGTYSKTIADHKQMLDRCQMENKDPQGPVEIVKVNDNDTSSCDSTSTCSLSSNDRSRSTDDRKSTNT